MGSGAGTYYVADNLGIEVFDQRLDFIRRIEPGLSFFSFAALGRGGFVINPNVRNRPHPLVEVLDGTGSIKETFNPPGSEGPGQRAFVAGCDNWAFAAQTDAPGAWLFNLETQAFIALHFPYPRVGELMLTAARAFKPRLIDSAPVFAAGVACRGGRFYLLTDSPKPRLAIFDLAGKLVALHEAGRAFPGYHFLGLALSPSAGQEQTMLYAVATDQNRKFWILRLALP